MLIDLEIIYKLNTFIDALPEAQRFFAYIVLYIGLPLLCFLLVYLDKLNDYRIQKKNINKENMC